MNVADLSIKIPSTNVEENILLRQDKDSTSLKLGQEAAGTSDEPTLRDKSRVRSGFKEQEELIKLKDVNEESDEEWRKVMDDDQSGFVESVTLAFNSSQDSATENKEDFNNEDGEYVLPMNWKEASTERDDMDCLGFEPGPWNLNVPYMMTKRKRHGLEAEVENVRKAKGRNTKTEKHGSVEGTLRKYIRNSKKEKGMWQVIKDKRKRLFDEKKERHRLKTEEGELHEGLWRENDYNSGYESDKDQRMTLKTKVLHSHDSHVENQLLLDMKNDLVARLENMKKQGRVAMASSCLSNDPGLLTPSQDEEEEEGEKRNVSSLCSSRPQTPENEQVFTRKDRGKLYKVEEELEDHNLKEWLDEDAREEKRRKYQQNYEMTGLAQVSRNFKQVNEYLRECRVTRETIMLEPRHFVLLYKMEQHPWVKKGITYEDFEKLEKRKAAAAYTNWALKSTYEKTMASVERLGKRYENIFLERLKAAMTDYLKETDRIMLDDWLRMCPFLMHGNNAKKILLHALPQFRNSDMNVLFKSWLDIGPLRDVLPLHHRICQWICLLEDPTLCVREVIGHLKVLSLVKLNKVNRITSPRPDPTRQLIKYATVGYERKLWQRFIYQVYIKGREQELKKFAISEGDWKKIREPILRRDRLNKVNYVDPVARHLRILKSFLKREIEVRKLGSSSICNDTSSDSGALNDDNCKETNTPKDKTF